MKQLNKMLEIELELKKVPVNIEKIDKMIYSFNKLEKEWSISWKVVSNNRNELMLKITV